MQLASIGLTELEARTLDHRDDGLEVTFWLESGTAPRKRSSLAAAVTLTSDDKIVGIANNADEHWDARDWIEPIDLDKFCDLHRRGDLVWVSNYGVLTYDAWFRYVDGDGIEMDKRKREVRRSVDLTEHRSRHGDGPGPLADTRPSARVLARSVQRLWWEQGPRRPTLHDRGQDPVTCPLCATPSTRRALGLHYVLVHNLSSSDAYP